MKVDAVLKYFEESPLETAEVISQIVNNVIKRRSTGGTSPVARKPRRKLSVEAKAAIAEGQRKRWEAAKKPGRKKSNHLPVEMPEAPALQAY